MFFIYKNKDAIYIASSQSTLYPNEKPINLAGSIVWSLINIGVTVYSGYIGYINNVQKILNCIISYQQVPALKELVFLIEPKAFVYIAETVEVNGNFKS